MDGNRSINSLAAAVVVALFLALLVRSVNVVPADAAAGEPDRVVMALE